MAENMINIPINVRIPDTYFLKAVDVVVEIKGSDIVAVNKYGNEIARYTEAYRVFRKVFSYLGERGGTIYVGPGEYVLNKMVVPAPWPNNMLGTIRIIGSGIDVTVIKAGSDAAMPTYGALFGYGYSGVNPSIARVEFYDLTIDGGYGETTSEPRDTAIINAGRERVLVNVKLTRSPGFTVFMGNGVRYWLYGVIFDNTGQPNDNVHRDIIGGGGASGVVCCTLYRNSAGNYLDHVNPGPVIFVHNMSENHKIGGFYGCGKRCIVAFNVLENVNSGSGIGKDAGTTDVEGPNIVVFNALKNIVVNKPPASPNDVYMDENGYLHLPPAVADHIGILSIAGLGRIARGGGGSQLSIEGGAYGIELWNANRSNRIALLRTDYIEFDTKISKIGAPLLSDCSNIPSSGDYEGQMYVCYDSNAAKWVLKVWDGSAWQSIG